MKQAASIVDAARSCFAEAAGIPLSDFAIHGE